MAVKTVVPAMGPGLPGTYVVVVVNPSGESFRAIVESDGVVANTISGVAVVGASTACRDIITKDLPLMPEPGED